MVAARRLSPTALPASRELPGSSGGWGTLCPSSRSSPKYQRATGGDGELGGASPGFSLGCTGGTASRGLWGDLRAHRVLYPEKPGGLGAPQGRSKGLRHRGGGDPGSSGMPLPALHAQGHEAAAGPVSPASPCDRASLHQVGTVSLTGGQGRRATQGPAPPGHLAVAAGGLASPAMSPMSPGPRGAAARALRSTRLTGGAQRGVWSTASNGPRPRIHPGHTCRA